MKSLLISIVLAQFACLLSGCGGASSTPITHPGVQQLRIISNALPNGAIQAPYGAPTGVTLSASGGVPPFTWTWASASGSSLPSGLELSPTGLISGTPTAVGTYNVTVTVMDSETPVVHASANYSITIDSAAPLGTLPNGVVGQSYGETFQVIENHCLATFVGWKPNGTSDMSGSPTWALSAAPGSSLPPGLAVGVETYTCGGSTRCCTTVSSPYLLHGVPTSAGTYHVIVTVYTTPQTSANYTITISGANSPVAATTKAPPLPQFVHYKLIDLGTFGGPQSYVNIPNDYAAVLNNEGTVAGWADTDIPDPYPAYCFNEEQPCYVSHVFQWRNKRMTDLGALPGGGSSASTWISTNGLIAGFSENGEFDPLLAGLPELRAALWRDGQILDLGVLPQGGYESIATAVNSRGQVVGAVTNTISDNFSLLGTSQTHAFIWEKGEMRDLGTLGGTDSEALLINETGQVIGESFLNSIPSPYCAGSGIELPLSSGAFLWEGGKMTNLGSFGGTCTFAADLNDKGEVVGLSTVVGDQYQHAFLWRNGILHDLANTLDGNNASALSINNNGNIVGWASLAGDQYVHASLWKKDTTVDLGTLNADLCSVAFSSNIAQQIVGISDPLCDFSQPRAFLWENGSLADLNALIPANSSLYLTSPETINDRGEIAGVGIDINGNQHAFLLIPCDAAHPGVEACDYTHWNARASTEIAPMRSTRVSSAVSSGAPFLLLGTKIHSHSWMSHRRTIFRPVPAR